MTVAPLWGSSVHIPVLPPRHLEAAERVLDQHSVLVDEQIEAVEECVQLPQREPEAASKRDARKPVIARLEVCFPGRKEV
jgi:hypothetical protein